MLPKLCLSMLLQLAVVSTSGASYEFTVRFYKFCNPLGLQCGGCENGGPPACCDDVQQTENCSTIAPHTCDTRIRFLLRPFGSSVKSAPNTGYRYFTPSNGGNSEMFNEGPGGLLGLQNPFTFNRTEIWTGRIQFHVDVIDRPIPMSTSGINETLAIINRFPINLELTPGPNFTEKTTYTGIYNISGVEFDMSFRVQCFKNYYGPNCTTFCESLKDVYTCSRDGSIVCLQERRNPTTNCTTCLPQFTGENCVALLAGAVGGAGAILTIILLVLCVMIILVVVKVKKKGKPYSTTTNKDTGDDSSTNSQTPQQQMITATVDTSTTLDHDFNNPLYAESVKDSDSVTEVKSANQMQQPLSTGIRNGVTVPVEYECPQKEKQPGVLNPYYGDVGGKTDHQISVSDSEQNSPSYDQPTRKNTFPYVTNDNKSSDSATNPQTSLHKYQNVHGLCAAVDDPGVHMGATITMNEYDVIERCNMTSSTSPAIPKPKSSGSADGPMYSLASEPVEGEVYNVAYPVLTPKAESSVVVDGYECLAT